MHQKFVHGATQFNWNDKWRLWIRHHENATPQEIIDYMNELFEQIWNSR